MTTTALVPVSKVVPVETDIDDLKGHVNALKKAKTDLKELEAYIRVLEDKITETLEKRDATDGKINNAVAVTWRPTKGYRFAEFAKYHPDIHTQYLEPQTVDVLNKERLLRDHPGLLARFQSRALLIK